MDEQNIAVTVNASEVPFFNPSPEVSINVQDNPSFVAGKSKETDLKNTWAKYNDIKMRIRVAREQIKGRLLENDNYATADQEVKAKSKLRKIAKEQAIDEDSLLFNMIESLDGLKADFSAIETVLGGQVIEYEKETGQMSLFDGQVEFEKVIRVKKN